jgi:hypothetical protein
MRYLIDGYNLLHATGCLLGKVGPGGLEKARRGLLDRLHDRFGVEAERVTVVFDASGAPPGAVAEQEYHGVRVCFAVNEEADDAIEDLIRRDSTPRRLTVVSDDNRLRSAARRRDCPVLGCLDFLDELARVPRPNSPDPSPRPDGVSGPEAARWLDEFTGKDGDPSFREWRRLNDFTDDGP